MVSTQGITWLFSCPDIIPNNINGWHNMAIPRGKGDENYAIYTTIGRAGGQADGFAYVLEKL